jgi:copper(I)-binding protein
MRAASVRAMISRRRVLALVACLSVIAALPPVARAEEENFFTIGAITVGLPWARAANAGADTLAFFKVDNAGAPDTLLSASTEVAGSIEIVGLVNRGGKIGTTVIGPIELPAGRMLFDPGGLGLALHDLTRDLVMGEDFDLTLTFQNAGPLTIPVGIEAPRAMLSSEDH